MSAPVVGSTTQEHQNRLKLLEQLQDKKKRLQHGHHAVPAATAAVSAVPMSSTSQIMTKEPSAVPGLTEAEYAMISNPQQRQALKHAHTNSVGYFITQDSAFGNLILPVLPRIADKVKVEGK